MKSIEGYFSSETEFIMAVKLKIMKRQTKIQKLPKPIADWLTCEIYERVFLDLSLVEILK